jgi:transposase-like protein
MARSVNSEKEAVWRKRLWRFGKSHLTVARFCRSEGVSAPTFYQWRKRLAEHGRQGISAATKPTESFVPVRVMAAVAPSQAALPVEIHLPNGALICLPSGDVVALRVGIQAAGELNRPTVAPPRRSRAKEVSRC